MKLTRRAFLSSGVGAALATMPSFHYAGTAEASGVHVSLVMGDHPHRIDVMGIFEELGLTVDLVSPAELKELAATRSSLLWIASSTYPDPAELSASELATIQKFLAAGKGVYAEFVVNFPGARSDGVIRKGGVARLYVVEAAGWEYALPAGTILDPNDAVCLPLEVVPPCRAIVNIAKVAGVEKVDPGIPAKNPMPCVVFGEQGKGRFAASATSLSEFARRQYAPQAHWRRLLRDLALTLLPPADLACILEQYIPLDLHTEPRRWAEPGSQVRVVAETAKGATLSLGGPAGQAWKETEPGSFATTVTATTTGQKQFAVRAARGRAVRSSAVPLLMAERRTVYRRALDHNIQWFERSGVLLRPDGTLGVAEWISGPDLEGHRIPFGKRQGFSPERADCVFESALAFWLYGKVAASQRHTEIGRNMMRNIMDFQRLGGDDEYYGLWYTRGREGPIFQDDEAWAIIGSLAGYRYMQNPMLLKRGRLAASTAAKVFAQGAPPAAGASDSAHAHPSDRGQMIAAWLYAYGVTGDTNYLDLALPALRELMNEFPKLTTHLIAHTGEATRFMLPLALACAYSGDPAFRSALREQADYLVSRMVGCGAIQEEGKNTGSKVQGGDLSLIHDSSEPISDQLYTTSFAAMNFWIAFKTTGEEFYRQKFFQVTDFLTRIQIESTDRTIDGGWMRGFDYKLWEYYGSNADQSWTAYCLETGWCNAIIDMAIALYLLDDSFYVSRLAKGAGSL